MGLKVDDFMIIIDRVSRRGFVGFNDRLMRNICGDVKKREKGIVILPV